jgi:membrane dipeptidase
MSDAGEFDPLSDAYVADARGSGLTAVNLTVSAVGRVEGAFEETFRRIGYWEQEIAVHPEAFVKVKTVADLEAAKSSHRLGLIYGFQDATPIGEDLGRLDMFYHFGVRIIQLTYNGRNLVGDGCLEPANAGLSRLGRRMIERMNEMGILIDLSHSGSQVTRDAITASKKPVAITHTGCAALAERPRNKTDDELRWLADRGGVAGIYLMPFLRMQGQPMAEDLIRHVEHAINVCGEDHVGIGTDGGISAARLTEKSRRLFREDIERRRRLGISAPGEDPEVYLFLPDLNTPRRFETIARKLLDRHHSEARVAKILGGNFLRLMRETWRPA